VADSRALPIAAEHREFTIKVGGVDVPRLHQLLSVSISLVANRIATARLCYVDGNPATSDFPLSNGNLFVPGGMVEILAGTENKSDSLFKGIVVRHAVRVRDHSASQLMVECRHPAMKMTINRQNAYYFDKSDSEVIEQLLEASKVGGDVAVTPLKHKQLVQFHTTDWDFLLARAEANGLLILPQGDRVTVKRAASSGTAVCNLQYGATLLELDAEIDARDQYTAVRGVSWDPGQQAVVTADGDTPAFTAPGNLKSDDLAAVAAVPHFELRHAALSEAEAGAWASATWTRSRLNQVVGRCKCEGIGVVHPGDIVTLSGVGQRFNGNVFVLGVRHEFDTVQAWKTHIQFGSIDGVPPQSRDQSAPPAGGLLASVAGLQIGVVASNEDPDGEHRVRIRLPLVNNEDDGIWARVASLDAGKDRGFFFRPEIGDEVVVGFLDADPRCAIILGMLHSSAKPAPLKGSDQNHEKEFKSRSGMRLYFNDEKKAVTIDTPAGNSITFSEDQKSIVLADQNGNKIEMSADGITIQSSKSLQLKAATECHLKSGTSLSVNAGTELTLEGPSKAELSSSGMTKVAGSMVQIN
jgi:Rhs element Vgr protein